MNRPPWIGPKTCTPSSLAGGPYFTAMPASRAAQEIASAIAATTNNRVTFSRISISTSRRRPCYR
ncbi:hypothetical protein [Micromonospora sp. NPDC023814]|uniref:hypothetical protein n=1 Tax=Micromonospora sp. NPDC023814 TaxID=3154596 RepID=UPI003408D7F5